MCFALCNCLIIPSIGLTTLVFNFGLVLAGSLTPVVSRGRGTAVSFRLSLYSALKLVTLMPCMHLNGIHVTRYSSSS